MLKKTLRRVIPYDNKPAIAEVEITLTDNLSIIGSIFVGKRCVAYGQIKDIIRPYISSEFYEVWDKWHLNHVNQCALDEYPLIAHLATYEERKAVLPTYGNRWHTWVLPDSVREYITSLDKLA